VRFISSFVIVLTLTMTGCTQGVVISDPERTATVILEKGYGNANLLGGSANMYFIETGTNCEGLQLIAQVGWMAGEEIRKSTPAGGLITIYGEVIIDTDGGYNAVRVNRCAQRGRFTPEIGKTYRIRQEGQLDRACTLSVLDEDTGKAPAEFVLT